MLTQHVPIRYAVSNTCAYNGKYRQNKWDTYCKRNPIPI
jgi:hypothetical protein